MVSGRKGFPDVHSLLEFLYLVVLGLPSLFLAGVFVF